MVETTTYGWHQSDLILRSALLEMIDDLRVNPWLIDFAFSSLRKDPKLKKLYEKEIAEVKDWFKNTEFAVLVVPRLDAPQLPCITIQVLSSGEVEGEVTLGDTHYQPYEDTNGNPDWPDLCPAFTPISYTPSTGELVIPETVSDSLVIVEGMVLIDATGKSFPILDANDQITLLVPENTRMDLRQTTIRGAQPAWEARLESTQFREQYIIGVHVAGEPVYVTYLHALLMFQLLRRKEDLLEGRGLERTNHNSTDVRPSQAFTVQLAFERFITMNGFVRQYWPKTVAQKIQYTQTNIGVVDAPDAEFDFVDLEDEVTTVAPTPPKLVYYGTTDDPDTLDQTFVKSLQNKVLATSRQASLPFTASETQYCWYATPVSFGGSASNFIDSETMLEAGWALDGIVVVDGQSYNVWRSNQPDLGSLTISVR